MSDATTGRRTGESARENHAEALLPDRRRDERLGPEQRRGELLLAQEADDVDALVGDSEPGEQQADGERIRAGHGQAESGAGVDLGPRPEQHLQALSRFLPAGEDDAVLTASRPGPRAGRGRRSG